MTQAADQSLNSLIEWGIGGAILAVFVAPTFWLMVKASQKREDIRNQRDEREAELRSTREGELIKALVASVEQQKLALEQWRTFEVNEERVHASILASLAQVSASLSSIVDRLQAQATAVAENASTHGRVADILQGIAHQLSVKAIA